MNDNLITLVIIPILVGLIVELISILVSHWLDENENN